MSFRFSKSVNDVTRIDRDSDVSDAEVDSDGSDDVFQLQLQVRPPISVGRLFGLTGCTCKLKIVCKFVVCCSVVARLVNMSHGVFLLHAISQGWRVRCDIYGTECRVTCQPWGLIPV